MQPLSPLLARITYPRLHSYAHRKPNHLPLQAQKRERIPIEKLHTIVSVNTILSVIDS